MKTLRVVKEKHYQEEEIKLSSADIQQAIKEFLEARFAKFQTGWNISVEYPAEAKAVCSKWFAFTCSKCNSSMTSITCKAKECQNSVCDKNIKVSKCCACLGNVKEER